MAFSVLIAEKVRISSGSKAALPHMVEETDEASGGPAAVAAESLGLLFALKMRQ